MYRIVRGLPLIPAAQWKDTTLHPGWPNPQYSSITVLPVFLSIIIPRQAPLALLSLSFLSSLLSIPQTSFHLVSFFLPTRKLPPSFAFPSPFVLFHRLVKHQYFSFLRTYILLSYIYIYSFVDFLSIRFRYSGAGACIHDHHHFDTLLNYRFNSTQYVGFLLRTTATPTTPSRCRHCRPHVE